MKTEINKRAGNPMAEVQKVVYHSDVTPAADGNYITSTKDVKANLVALDTQLKAASDAAAAQSYTIAAKATPKTGFAATYVLQRGGVDVSGSAEINIPKDMVVESGSVVDITFRENKLWDGATDVTEAIKGSGGTATAADAGKYVKLVIANAASTALYINAKDLVDTYTAEQNATQVQLAIDANNVISATIVAGSIDTTELKDGSVTTAKIADENVTTGKIADRAVTTDKIANAAVGTTQLDPGVNASLGKADSAVQGVTLALNGGTAASIVTDKVAKLSVTTGTNNGTIKVNGTEVSVAGLGSAAYTASTDYATSAQGAKADSAIQGVKIGGSALTPDANKVVDIPNAVATGTTGATNGLLTADDKKKLDDLATTYKPLQTAITTDPTASGTASDVVTSVKQDANGVITVTRASLPAAVKPNWNAAEGDAAGILNKPLLDGTYDQTTNKIATQSTVTNAINALDVPAEGTGAITGMGAGKTIATLTETDGKVAATFQDIQIAESQVTGLTDALAAKVDKVTGATANHIATFVTGGGIQDSGKVVGDFATAAQGDKADTAVQSVTGDSGVTVSTSDHAVTVAAKVDGSTVEVDSTSQNIQVKDGGITTAKIADANVTTAKLAVLTSFQIMDTATTGDYTGQVYTITIDHGVLTVTPAGRA